MGIVELRSAGPGSRFPRRSPKSGSGKNFSSLSAWNGPWNGSRSSKSVFRTSGRKCPVHRGTEAAGLERPPRGVRSTLGPFRRGSRTGNRVLSASRPTKSGPENPVPLAPLRKPFIKPPKSPSGPGFQANLCTGRLRSCFGTCFRRKGKGRARHCTAPRGEPWWRPASCSVPSALRWLSGARARI